MRRDVVPFQIQSVIGERKKRGYNTNNLATIEAISYGDKQKLRSGRASGLLIKASSFFANIIILIEAGKLRFTPQNHNTGMLTDS